MAPTITIPMVEFPPPTFTNIPFFGPMESWSGSNLSKSVFGISNSSTTSSQSSSPSVGMEMSMRKVLAKYGATDLHEAALLPSYRSLRRRRPQVENQAVAVTQDKTSYKIMLDVREFAEGTLSVRGLGDNELIVEGVVEKKAETSSSENCKSVQSSSRNFQQRFMFPDLMVDGVTSTVSSDGVLTITAPRRISEATTGSNAQTSQQSQSSTQRSSTVQKSSVVNQSQSSVSKESVRQESSRLQQSSLNNQEQSAVPADSSAIRTETVRSSGEHIVPIEVEGEHLTNKSGDVQKDHTADSLQSSQQKTSTETRQQSSSVIEQSSTKQTQQQQKSSPQQKQQTTQQQQQQQLSTEKSINTQILKQDEKVDSNSEKNSSSVRNIPINTSGTNDNSAISTRPHTTLFNDALVTIDSRGMFFQDAFFENSRRQFQEAVQKIMKRISSDVSPHHDPMDWYTNHRALNLLEDTRAATITTEGNDYKIVLDVRDFEAGSVSVRAMGDSELLVEGKMEKKTEGTSISRSFRRRFVMPGLIKCEAITSALSADGVLTITVPKNNTFQIVEVKDSASKNILSESSVFGSQTPSCASPSISIPVSSVTSPTSDVSGPFGTVYSKSNPTPNVSSLSQTSSVNNMSQVSNDSSRTLVNEQCQQVKSSSNEVLKDKILNDQKEFTRKIDINTNEKIVDINYIDKNQVEIDGQNRVAQAEKDRQFQLIGSVKDLTDSSLKEDVKQRKSVTSSSQTRDITVKYDNPAGFVFPIVRRGPFYQDSFFNEVHQNFQSAIRQVLDRWVDVPSLLFNNTTNTRSLYNMDHFHNTLLNYSSILERDIFDDLTCYKTLRHRSLKEESQAATVKENANDFKIVIDVHGFSEKELSIRATAHNELVIQGKTEETGSGGSHSCYSFKKQFILPGRVRMDAVYSALSADDVLTITVPKNTALSITN